MRETRSEIERFLVKDPFFGSSYEPVDIPAGPIIIRDMAIAAKRAGVGPMAAVAGAIARGGVQAACKTRTEYCVIDNGGDIAIVSDRVVRIGLYAGESPLSGRYAFVIDPKEKMYGVCTSSATVGHSFSFGTADSVTVFSDDIILADAIATAVCNTLTLEDQSCLQDLDPDIDGVYAVFHDKSLMWGDIPPIVRADNRDDLITAGGLGFLRKKGQ